MSILWRLLTSDLHCGSCTGYRMNFQPWKGSVRLHQRRATQCRLSHLVMTIKVVTFKVTTQPTLLSLTEFLHMQ